jgi:transcriptional regulator with XRE-family HTH domain
MAGGRKPPRPRDRIIGARLRAIRKERTNLSLEAAARLLGWGLATMSRIENGRRHISTEDIATILGVYQIPAAERRQVVAEAKAENSSGWWERPLPGVPTEMGTLASYEADAISLTDWSVSLVPGLLQTEAYAMAVMLSDGVPQDVADLRWLARRRRQKILGNLDYSAFISETALWTPFGGPEAHQGQLAHLLTARDRGIGVRIVRERLPVGLVSHSWLYMTFPRATPVVNVEVAEGGIYLHDEQAALYTRLLARLERIALSVMDSQTMLRYVQKEA